MIPMQRILGCVKTQRIPDQSFHLVFDWHSSRRHKFAVLQTYGQMAAKQEITLIGRGDLFVAWLCRQQFLAMGVVLLLL